MPEVPAVASRATARAMALLVAMRIVYAYNWFDLGPGLPFLGAAIAPQALWGLFIAAFLAGAATFQVPAGLLARRRGNRPIALLGAAVLGGSSLVSALATNLPELILLRFVGGAGAGLFFSPAIALVTNLHAEGKRGVFVGLFSSAFAAGAGLGTFLPAILDQAYPATGWRVSLALGGGMMLLLWLLGTLWIPQESAQVAEKARSAPRGLPPALRSPAVWGIGLAFVGLEGASISSGQYFAAYALLKDWNAVLAGTVAALFVLPSLFGGPVGGRLTERFTNRRTQFVVFTAFPALLLILVPFSSPGEVGAIATTFAFCFGMVYAMMYVIPPYLPGLTTDDVPLAVGLLNAVQLAGGACITLVVGYVIATRGYAAGWELLGVAVVVPLVFLVLLPRTGSSNSSVARSQPGAAAVPPPGHLE